ncbi:MAG: TonB-dependent receptor, partial [Candidatus Cloacimonetes bacterium]|nr:TonB-dependent receptor [Candidatus Cloacimonadota bacterium]
VKSVQVQKGAGSSLYGSGAFGGSLNIETIGSTPQSEITIRSSYGYYSTDGNTADGKGSLSDYEPFNYNVITRYNSGNLWGGKFNYNIMLERKVGDYYINGTNYRGYSFGLEAQQITGNHTFNYSFLGAPQSHNQVYRKSDPKLFDTLGRSYSRNNHEYQENYYFKPQFSIRDEWKISDNKVMMTNFFITKGDGGGKYLYNDKFDIETGEVMFHDGFLDDDDPARYQWEEYARHAKYLYETYGIEVEEFNPNDSTYIESEFFDIWTYYQSYNGQKISGSGYDFWRSRYDYSWRNNRISDHFQMGGNTYFENKFYTTNIKQKEIYNLARKLYKLPSPIGDILCTPFVWAGDIGDLDNSKEILNIVLGGEIRKWHANHIGKRENFRHFNPDFPDSVETYETMQKLYDYTSDVINMSTFARFQIKPIEQINIMIDGQYGYYTSKVSENPVEIYDLGTGEPTGHFFYATKEMTNADSTLKFSEDDYSKAYSFFSPKCGINYNISEYFNIIANYSIAYKEPRTKEWYSGYYGPDGKQLYSKNIVLTDSLGNYYNQNEEHFYGELKPEKINTFEVGIGYDGIIFDIEANYYRSDYTDKIEYVTLLVTEEIYHIESDSVGINQYDTKLTLNTGQARHQGLELTTKFKYDNFDASNSVTLSSNKWTEMNVEEIFDGDADDIVGNVVPFSPEKMANFSLGYTFKKLPLDGKFRIGLSGKYWDGYYANHENEYECVDDLDGDNIADTTYTKSSKLPLFVEFGVNLKYSFKIVGKDAFIKFAFNNILNRDNYSSANFWVDHNRGYFNEDGEFVDDYLTAVENMYVTPSPLFNMFVTLEVKF